MSIRCNVKQRPIELELTTLLVYCVLLMCVLIGVLEGVLMISIQLIGVLLLCVLIGVLMILCILLLCVLDDVPMISVLLIGVLTDFLMIGVLLLCVLMLVGVLLMFHYDKYPYKMFPSEKCPD